jgi:putative membrane protein
MDEGPITHPGVPKEVYHRLGKKTFWIFLLERVHAAFVILLLAIALMVVAGQPSLAKTPVGNLANIAALAALAAWAFFVVALAITFLVAWLIYANYKYCLGEDSLKIKRGIINREEVAIPYRQIQDVDIDRDLTFQMMGLSRLDILTAGREDIGAAKNDDESEGQLPALDKDLAEWLQAELLRRANVQKVTEENPAEAPAPAADDKPPAS